MTTQRDDILTTAAIGVLAAYIATLAHEAVGHGLACLALGGEVTQLTTVYFQCSTGSTAIAAAGPAGNLAAAALAWFAFSKTPTTHARARLLQLLILAFSIFWFAGHLIYSAVLRTGDLYFVALDLVGEPSLALRIAALITAVAIYLVGVSVAQRLSASLSRDTKRLRELIFIAWAAASVSAAAAATAYAPDRLSAAGQAALQIGLASLPLLSRAAFPRATQLEPNAIIERSWLWIGGSTVGFALFVATLGRGLP